MAYDPVTKIYTPEYTPNPDKYIQDMNKIVLLAIGTYISFLSIYLYPIYIYTGYIYIYMYRI